jgi:hypothetical protein
MVAKVRPYRAETIFVKTNNIVLIRYVRATDESVLPAATTN